VQIKVLGMNLAELRQRVEKEIEGYVYAVPTGAVGNPWSNEKVKRELRALKAALVEPYWAIITNENGERLRSAVVADDGNRYLIVFQPTTGMFVLVERHGANLISFGADGDAVGCFLSR
jgi:hypothetical protein